MEDVEIMTSPSEAFNKDAQAKNFTENSFLKYLTNSTKVVPFYELKEKGFAASFSPRLSGQPGDLIDFDDEAGEKVPQKFQRPTAKSVLSAAVCTIPSCLSIAKPVVKPSTSAASATDKLSRWKNEVEKKMKVQREEGMTKRQRLYEAEKGEDANDEESEEEEELTDEDDETVEADEEVADVVADEEEEMLRKDAHSTAEPHIEPLDTQDLHLLLVEDTEKMEELEADNNVRDNFDVTEAEIPCSLITPYQRPVEKPYDESLISNTSNIFAFPPEDSQELDKPYEKFNESSDVRSRFHDLFDANSSTPKCITSRRSVVKDLFDNDNDDSIVSQELLDLCSGQFLGACRKSETAICAEDRSIENASKMQKELKEVAVDVSFDGDGFDSNKNKNVNDLEPESSVEIAKNPVSCNQESSVNSPKSACSRIRNRIDDERALDGFVDDDEEDDGPRNSIRRVKLFVLNDDDDENTKTSSAKLTNKRSKVNQEDEENEVGEDAASIGESSVDEDEDAEEVDSSDDEEKMVRYIEQNKFRDAKGKLREDFIEKEAELSGDEVESDDEEGPDDDEMEIEEGDFDEMPSEGELREEVGKIHHKIMLDDDKRQVLLYKEKYLEDGDMHSDEVGRRLRWRRPEEEDANLDANAMLDFKADADDLDNECKIEDERGFFVFNKFPSMEETTDDADDPISHSLSNAVKIRRSVSMHSAPTIEVREVTEVVDLFSAKAESSNTRESFLRRRSEVLKKIVRENSDSNSASTMGMVASKSLFTNLQSPDAKPKRRLSAAAFASASDNCKKQKVASQMSVESVFDLLV